MYLLVFLKPLLFYRFLDSLDLAEHQNVETVSSMELHSTSDSFSSKSNWKMIHVPMQHRHIIILKKACNVLNYRALNIYKVDDLFNQKPMLADAASMSLQVLYY